MPPPSSSVFIRHIRRRLLLLTALLLLAIPVAAQSGGGCTETLRRAEDAYRAGRFEEAIRLTTPCLADSTFDKEQIIRAHRLLSMAHMNSGDAHGARLAILDLLRLVPEYEPDPVQDPPSYTVLVMVILDQKREAAEQLAEEQPQRTSWAKRTGTWLGIGGGLVIVGLTAILAGDGGTNGP